MKESLHAHFMKQALKQAEIALDKGEVPVGAVVVHQNRVIAKAYNQMEQVTEAVRQVFAL